MSLPERKKTAVIDVVAIFVAFALGTFCVFQVTGTMGEYAENSPAAATMDNIYSSVEDTAGTVFSLLTVIVIAVIAVVILAVCLRSLGGAFAPPGGK